MVNCALFAPPNDLIWALFTYSCSNFGWGKEENFGTEQCFHYAQVAKELEGAREQADADTKMILRQVEKESDEMAALIKKERKERERAMDGVKEKTENDKKELQISIDKDRDNFSRRLAEEHDQVRRRLRSYYSVVLHFPYTPRTV